MMYCPNTKCKAKSHATDAMFCHLCGTKLIDDLENDKKKTTEPLVKNNTPYYSTSNASSPTTAKGASRGEKWIMAILVIMYLLLILLWIT